jgi:diguanylate cyclase (GGDEF)-like protein
LGGEEFLIILVDTPLEKGHQVAERLRSLVENRTFTYKDKKIPVTISLGVAQYTQEKDLGDFLKKVDDALYQAKNNGRNKSAIAP